MIHEDNLHARERPVTPVFGMGARTNTQMVRFDDAIRSYFSGKPEIAAVYLFGSRASGKHQDPSDVDIALLLQTKSLDRAGHHLERTIIDLGRITRKDIHPVVMNTAGESLLQQILGKGRQLVVNDPEFLKYFLMHAIGRIAEFGYYRRMFQCALQKHLLEATRG